MKDQGLRRQVLAFYTPPTYFEVWSWANSVCLLVSGSPAVNRNQNSSSAFFTGVLKCFRGRVCVCVCVCTRVCVCVTITDAAGSRKAVLVRIKRHHVDPEDSMCFAHCSKLGIFLWLRINTQVTCLWELVPNSSAVSGGGAGG